MSTRTRIMIAAATIILIVIVVISRDRDASEPNRASPPQASSETRMPTTMPMLPHTSETAETLSPSKGVPQQPPSRTLDTQLPALKPREGAPPTQPHGKQMIVETARIE